MRKLFVLGFSIITSVAVAQNKDTVGLHTPFTNGEVVYQKTFKSPGKSKDQLFGESRTWFEKRYNGTDSLVTQNSTDGILTGKGWEKLIFKGPLNMDVASRTSLTIEVDSKDDTYTIHVSNIVIGYQEDGKLFTYFTAEDLMNHVLGNKYTKGPFDPVPFNKKRSLKALTSLNELVANVISSANRAIAGK